MVELEQLDEVGRRACLKPVAAEAPVGKGIQQAERIVHAHGIFRKVIAVVIGFQFSTRLLVTHPRSRSQLVNILLKVGVHFLLTDAADFRILVDHGNVPQVVQIAEHADLAELGHSRQQGKADAAVHGLQCSVERLQGAAVLVLQVFVADGLQHGLVVFIDENHHPAACLLACTADEALETERKACFTLPCAISAFPIA